MMIVSRTMGLEENILSILIDQGRFRLAWSESLIRPTARG